jgi:hypothetical protein
MKEEELRALLCASTDEGMEKMGELWAAAASCESRLKHRGTPPRVFCERVRKLLIEKG